jgi:hypothetical protein
MIRIMKTGVAVYNALIRGTQIYEIEVSPNYPFIDKCIIKTEPKDECENLLVIKIFLNNIESIESVQASLNELAHSFADKISFEFDAAIEEPCFRGGSINTVDENGRHLTILADTIMISCKVDAVLSPGPSRIEQLKKILITDPNTRDVYISMFRFAISQSDPVLRFMFLYYILLTINNDKQREVDKFIIHENPGTPQTKSPKHGRPETIYTRLRNELGHPRTGVNLQNTYIEIRNNVSIFQSLVKKAILDLEL